MLPISVLVATVAMASGVEGATFFAPILIIGLGLPAEIAIGTGLITEVFGFASGLYAYRRKGLIDYRLGLGLLFATIPLALAGTWLSTMLDASLLKFILSLGLFAIGVNFLRSPHESKLGKTIANRHQNMSKETCLTALDGEEICYPVCNKNEARLFAGVGSLFMGMVGTGLGEMNGYYFLRRCHIPAKVAVATSVFVVAISALIASTGHLIKFAQAGGDSLNIVFSLVIFTVPGVIFGGQIGSAIASRIAQRHLELSIAVLFILLASFVLVSMVF